MAQGTASRSRSVLSRAGATALSIAVLNAAAAVAGILFAREFGRGPETDGLFLAFNVYVVLVLAASALRVVVLPELTRAAGERRLERAVGGYAATVALVGAGALAGAGMAAGAVAVAGSGETARLFAESLPWFVLAGGLQLVAALCASALAARDDYHTAALAYALGGAVGLAAFVALRDAGPASLAWSTVVNGVVTVAVLAAALARHAVLPALGEVAIRRRLSTLGRGAALPIALQALYAIAGPFALRLGAGSATTFTYAYLVAASLVAVTATSISLISSAPLTRRGLTPEAAARHVVAAAWLALSVVAPATGVFALVGGRIVGGVLGDAYGGEVGRELGEIVVWLAPWMVASTALTVSFPLLFVVERPRVLVPLALALPLAQAPLAWGLSAWLGLVGLALSLTLTTLAALAVLMAGLSRRTLALAAAGIGRLALVLSGLAALSFGLLALVLGDVAAAAAGLVVYVALLSVARPLGLRAAWQYARALE